MRILIDGQTLLTPEIDRGIGIYLRNVLVRILEQNFDNEYFVNVARKGQLQRLSSWARGQLTEVESSAYDPANASHDTGGYFANLYSDTINDDLQRHGIDLYWSPNPLMNNVFLPEPKSERIFSATIYDAIVLRMRERYLDRWPAHLRETYLKKLEILKSSYNLLLYISESSRLDFEAEQGAGNRTHVVTHLAADEFFKPDPFPTIATDMPYLLYIGGFDPRKNMEGAVQAFGEFRNRCADESLRNLCLYIVCNFDSESEARLKQTAKEADVASYIHLTGFVDEFSLRALYQKARALFFPSLYEGFGLPVLEALACGIPVACGRTSSLPEVGGRFAEYFDPFDIDDMVRALFRTVAKPLDIDSRLARHQYSRTFSWQRTAAQTLGAFEKCMSRISVVS
jgi:glycosyltransferase involved in cell wall biosynthesis